VHGEIISPACRFCRASFVFQIEWPIEAIRKPKGNIMPTTQKIKTYLWFDSNAEEAVSFYTSLFKNSKILDVMRYGDGGPGPKGAAMLVTFQLEGQEFIALNGGPQFKFTEAISLLVDCESQEEVDELWEKLTADGGAPSQCGWLKDKFGLSWQIIPKVLIEMLKDKNPERSKRVMETMLQMSKIDIGKLNQAYEQG
jgi:predicted 3-demethylubiquinone-9 3-methyltransferase (glyoxalase superfamily)